MHYKIKVIIGGGHPSALPEHALEVTGADIVIVGEGEGIINKVIDDYSNYRYENVAYGLPSIYQGTQLSIDQIKKPRRDLLDRKNYHVSYAFENKEKLLCASVITSRGCPFPCNYCASKKILGNQTRFRTVDNIIEEIEDLLNLGVEAILFLDDCFTLNKKRVEDLCNEILRKNLKFYWWLDTRVDCVSQEMLYLMYLAGCRFIVYGVESGCQAVLDRIGKKITINKIKNTFQITHNAKIDTKANFMFGHLDETSDEIKESITLAKDLHATRYGFYLALPLPGSSLYDIADTRGVIHKDFDKFKWYDEPVSNISKTSSDELLYLQRLAYRECEFKK